MNHRMLSLLPDWSENADLRGMLFTFTVVFGGITLKKNYGLGEAPLFLTLGFLAIVVVYWIPPRPRENYVRWIAGNSVLLFGLFLFVFKIPWVFSSFLNYRLAQVLCIGIYVTCCWFLIRLKERRRLSGL